MKLILLCLMLTSCNTVTTKCDEMAVAQYKAACRIYGKENAQLWRLKNDKPVTTSQGTFLYHMQVKVRPDGPGTPWGWLPNRPYTEIIQKHPQTGCKPYKRLK